MPHKYYNAINIFYKSQYFALAKIWKRYRSWERAWRGLAKKISVDPDQEWERLKKYQINLILKSDEEYPKLLKEIPLAPFALYVKGMPRFTSPAIAIVGTRKSTADGQALSYRFAQELAGQNITVISGLALGIDQAAHRGAVESGGQTVAVLANGLDTIYPRQHTNLATKIIAGGGAIVSEYAPGTPPYPTNFLERNRIISGLSAGAIILEAPYGSGALATAQYAVDQNREVFVVPGSINHINYAGSNNLIQKGAALITGINDIFASMNWPLLNKQKSAEKQLLLSQEQKLVLNYIEHDGQSLDIDKIVELTRMEPRLVNQAIAFLLVHDIIKENNGQYYL